MSEAIINKMKKYSKAELSEQVRLFPDIERDLSNSVIDVVEEVYLRVHSDPTFPASMRILADRAYFSKVDKLNK